MLRLVRGVNGFVKKSELAKERGDQRVDRFAVDEKIDGRIMSIDSNTREVNLSIKALQVAEEKQAMKDYGSVDSGASLGDILGAALEKKLTKQKKNQKQKKQLNLLLKKLYLRRLLLKKLLLKKLSLKKKNQNLRNKINLYNI